MQHLQGINSSSPRWGVNRTTAIAIVSSLAVFSTFLFFGLANAMLPDRVPAAGLGDRDVDESTGRVPALESPDGTEAVAVRTSSDEQVVEGTTEPASDDDISSGASTGDDNSPTGRATRGQQRATPRGAPRVRASSPADDEGGSDRDGDPIRGATCDSSDPLCGVDFGGPLDA